MKEHPRGTALVEAIERTDSWMPVLWWLGHSGFVVKYHSMIFYVDPCLTNGQDRLTAPPLDPAGIRHADLVLATHTHARHMDPGTLVPLLNASPRAKLVLPKSAAGHAASIGVGYHRMTTTDANLRIEYFSSGDYTRVYAVPSAHTKLDHTPIGGYPYLGYLIRCGGCTIYHAGDGVPYDQLADFLRPYSVTVALLPVDGRDSGNFSVEEAADLGAAIGAQWIVPMHYGTFPSALHGPDRFIEHMLFHHPSQRFKVFECGEGWAVPED